MVNNTIINGVWHGERPLTNLQKLCIRSYQDAGHEFHLWHNRTKSPEGTPDGTMLRNVAEVMPLYVPSFAGENYYSDYFRVVLIEQIGGWYVDLDTVCLRPFDFSDDYAFVSESRLGPMKATTEPTVRADNRVQEYLSGCIFKAPAHHPMLKWIISTIEGMDTIRPRNWICMGPELFQAAIPKFNLLTKVHPPSVFDALNYNELEHFVTGGVKWDFPYEAHAIHLRTSFWQEKYHPILKADGAFAPDSLYEQLKEKHGVKNV